MKTVSGRRYSICCSARNSCEALPSLGEYWLVTYDAPYGLESDPGYDNHDSCSRPEPISYMGSDHNQTLVSALWAAPVGINSLGVGGLGNWRIVVDVATAAVEAGSCDSPTAVFHEPTRETEFSRHCVVAVPRAE